MAITTSPILSGLQTVSTAGECSPGSLPQYTLGGTLPQTGNTGAAPFGGISTHLPLTSGANNDGSALAATASSGKFGVSATPGTSLLLLSEGAKNNTKTDIMFFEFLLPASYVAGSTFSVTINSQATANGGTLGTHTVVPTLYKFAANGTMGSDLIGASAATVTTSAADYVFTVTTPALVAFNRVLLQLAVVVQETANAGTNSTIQINSVRIS